MARFIKRFKRMSFVKKVVCIALAIGTTVGSVFGVKAIVEKVKDDQKTIHPTFAVGGLIETNGEHDQNEKAAIYTKDAFSAKGLNIKLDFDSTVQYQVFFYNELDNFISCTEVYEKSADIVVPLEAYARIEVTPIWGEDAPLEKEIKWHEVTKYSKQLEIRVDKEQRLLESDFTKYELTGANFVKHAGKTISAGTLGESAETDLYEFSLKATESGYQLENDCLLFAKIDRKLTHDATANIGLWVMDGSTPTYYMWGDFEDFTAAEPLKVNKGCKFYVQVSKTFLTSFDVDMFLYFCVLA